MLLKISQNYMKHYAPQTTYDDDLQRRIYIVKFWTRPPPQSKFFQFHAVFGKFWQNCMLAPPPRGNSGSATDLYGQREFFSFYRNVKTTEILDLSCFFLLEVTSDSVGGSVHSSDIVSLNSS